VRAEVGAKADQIVYTTEYMHPRMEEVCGTLPKRLGQWIEDRPKLFARLDRWVNRGRRVRTGTLFWFVGLYLVSAMRGSRPRHAAACPRDRASRGMLATPSPCCRRTMTLALEALECRRLVKGYSDTHARGLSKFDKVMAAVPLLAAREDGAAWLRRPASGCADGRAGDRARWRIEDDCDAVAFPSVVGRMAGDGLIGAMRSRKA